MAKARTKPAAQQSPEFTLSRSRDIPLDKIVLSQSNVRQVKAGVSIEDLAEDIARRTLLQSLTVRPVRDAAGAETGFFEAIAGGRRLRALQLLVKQDRLAPDAPVPCIIRDKGLAEEDSLAENVQRAALHPVDQFRAFKTLRERGRSEDEIASAFFVSVSVVRQRLKLAAVAPALLDLYADDRLTLAQLMAFTVSPDEARQMEVWKAVEKGHAREPWQIKRLLTEGAVRGGDKRARFVGVEAYVEAGGEVLRDLFSEADDVWLADSALVARLAAEKLEAAANAVHAEGWNWVEAAIEFPYGHAFGLGRVVGADAALSADDQRAYDALRSEFEALEAAHEGVDELPEDVDRRLGEIESEMEAFDQRPLYYAADDLARAGAFVSVGQDGALRVERGFVRPEDDQATKVSEAKDDVTAESLDFPDQVAINATSSDDDETDSGLSRHLIAELTTYRSLALRQALAASPETARLALLHALALTAFYPRVAASCLRIAAQDGAVGASAIEGLVDFAAARAFDARHDAWRTRLPADAGDLWTALVGLDADERDRLLAHCVAASVDAIDRPYNRAPAALLHADALAAMLRLDLREAGWVPTAANYFGRVTKARIVAAVEEGRGAAAARRLDGVTKPDMARAAEELLRETAWLPEILRSKAGEDAVAAVDDATEVAPFVAAAE